MRKLYSPTCVVSVLVVHMFLSGAFSGTIGAACFNNICARVGNFQWSFNNHKTYEYELAIVRKTAVNFHQDILGGGRTGQVNVQGRQWSGGTSNCPNGQYRDGSPGGTTGGWTSNVPIYTLCDVEIQDPDDT